MAGSPKDPTSQTSCSDTSRSLCVIQSLGFVFITFSLWMISSNHKSEALLADSRNNIS